MSIRVRFDPAAFLAKYDELDALLVSAGFPATSAWWRREIERFVRALASGRRRWVIRAGRRAGKSTTLTRLAVAWALWGTWSVPPGDTAIIPFVSVSREEAAARIRGIADTLQAMGATFERRGDEIELGGRRVVFRVQACSVRAVVGFTSIAVFGDEVAKWEDRETAANPAPAVVSSLAPSLATQPFGFLVLSSSPWTRDDYHAEQFDRGDTEHQITSFAATWTANPTLTEGACRALSDTLADFLREFAGIPPESATLERWFGDTAARVVQTGQIELTSKPGIKVHAALDLSTSYSSDDRIGYAVAQSYRGEYDHVTHSRGPSRTVLLACGSWPVDRSPREIARRFRAEVATRFGTNEILIDQFSDQSFAELCRDVGLRPRIIAWRPGQTTVDVSRESPDDREPTKLDRYRSVRTAMANGDLLIPDNPELLADLHACRGILLPGGSERVEVPRSKRGHGDCLAAAVMACSQALISTARIPDNDEQPWEYHNRVHAISIIQGYAKYMKPFRLDTGIRATASQLLEARPTLGTVQAQDFAALLHSPSASITIGGIRHRDPARRAELLRMLENESTREQAIDAMQREFKIRRIA